MGHPGFPSFVENDIDAIADATGVVFILAEPGVKLDILARRVNRLSKGAVARAVESAELEKKKDGEAIVLNWPAGMRAEAIVVLRLPRRAATGLARNAGGVIGKLRRKREALILAGNFRHAAALAQGVALRSYTFGARKSKYGDPIGAVTMMVAKPTNHTGPAASAGAVVQGVWFARDLVNEPANHLTTSEFAARLTELSALGLKIDILDEAELAKKGMRALLAVGQASKVVVMRLDGGKKGTAPLALVGKGVVFDAGGVSLKPAAGMEDMTMDMGGAAAVAGAMKALALRKARANVVGLVGLVENMPDGRAQRPGDVVTTMKGDTVEVINTDAEGRLVLCDVMWYAQKRFAPVAMVDLATLTGAIVIALGHHKAGVFSNDAALSKAFLNAADKEGEGAWAMPLDAAYEPQLKSRVADVRNTGGRPAGSITAAQFLARFVQDGTPWLHIDIAGVASLKSETALSPAEATGWGVCALDRFVADRFEI